MRQLHIHIYTRDAIWKEGDHPRKDNGQFGQGSVDSKAAFRYLGAIKREPHLLAKANEAQTAASRTPWTDDEFTALRSYLDNNYIRFNVPLRKGGFSRFKNGVETVVPIAGRTGENFRAAVALTTTALAKLPAYKGTVRRALSFYDDAELSNFLAAHKPGLVVSDKGFASTTKGEITALSPNIWTKAPTVHLEIESITGRDVDVPGLQSHLEGEVLFPPGTKFRVVSAERKGTVHVLKLKEEPDARP